MNLLKISFDKIALYASIMGAVASAVAFISFFSSKDARINNDNIKINTNTIPSIVITGPNIQETNDIKNNLDNYIKKNSTNLNSIEEKLKQLKEEQEQILIFVNMQKSDKKQQEKFIDTVSDKVKSNLSDSLSGSIKKVSERFEKIETIITTDADKALSIPLIKRDIEEVNKEMKLLSDKSEKIDMILIDNAALKAQADSLSIQLSQLNNWMIGIFGTLGVSVIGLLINHIFAYKKITPSE